jgi:para-nitrobenzyl esterase
MDFRGKKNNKKKMKRSLILFCFIAFSGMAQVVQVKTRQGIVEGEKQGSMHRFLGIPFAQPPVGDLRWKAPQEITPWQGVKLTKAYGPSPMQAEPKPFQYWSEEFLIPKEPINEDCLYLNVWSDSKIKLPKPVLVYIYGGGFRSGGAACPIYDGAATASKGVVFVSINYRVGTFGFFAHPELSKESAAGVSGNYGLLDMIAALKWIKANIAAFGGDPNQVTIAGQSAGASAVNYLCASPLAKGLFQRAIAESGSTMLRSPLRPTLSISGAEAMGIEFASKLGANNIQELRSKSAEEILKTSGGLSSPYLDGYVEPLNMLDAYAQHQVNDVSLLIGWNDQDVVSSRWLPASEYQQNMAKKYGAKATAMLAFYPASNDVEASISQRNLSRDETFGAGVFYWAKTQLAYGKSPVFVYNFNRQVPGYTEETRFGAFHTGEVPYAYDNLDKVRRPFESVDFQLAKQVSNYWVNFAKTGNPNAKGLPEWPKFQLGNEVMQLDVETKASIVKNSKALELIAQ